MSPLNIAIVGAGMIGAVHRRAAILAGAVVRGVCASTPSRSKEVATEWNVSHAYAHIDDVIADPQVHVVQHVPAAPVGELDRVELDRRCHVHPRAFRRAARFACMTET